MPGIRTRRLSHPRTKPFLRVRMPGVCACACAYLISVNQALGFGLTLSSRGGGIRPPRYNRK